VQRKGRKVVVSRADPALRAAAFRNGVPEIYDGTVQIRAVGSRSRRANEIAVESRDKDVDPVGACVGMKGMRVQSIIRELRGEKIDIIPYNEETIAFAQKALSPAKVTRVQVVDPEEKRLEVIVEDTQLSLAIGKKGQNVRLASKIDRLEYRHQERGREAPGDRSADGRAHRSRNAAHRISGRGSEDDRETRSCWNHFSREARGYDPEQLVESSGYRREDG